MSWKKYLEPIFSQAYYRQLMRRYLWLIYVPVSIFLGFVFLCGVLDLGLAAMGVMLFPYAVFIVPTTALLLFNVYTKKTEASHLFSMPITRRQNLISTYFAGLSLILIPLMLMSCVYSFTGIGKNILTFIAGMFFLAVIYYSFSVLGCLLGGTLMAQLMMIGVISFGPLLLYVIVNICLSLLALGNVPVDFNKTIISAFCPLLSGATFIFNGVWSYWYIHIVMLLGIGALCLYLVQIRPFELSGQSVVFAGTQNYLMRPILYLTVVYVIFYICSLGIFQESYFDTAYYTKIVTVLAGTGILVAFVFNVWFSRDLRSLFSWKNIQQTFLMTLLACSLFLIPLKQKENSRKDYPEGGMSITFSFPDRRYSLSQEYNTYTYRRKIDRLLDEIDISRSHFVNSGYFNDEGACILSLNFYSQTFENSMYQEYYILPEDISGYMNTFIRDFLIDGRQNALNYFVNDASNSRYFQSTDGALYDREQLAEVIQESFSSSMPQDYFKQYEENVVKLYNEAYSTLTKEYESLFELYLRSLTTSDFKTWVSNVLARIDPVLSGEEVNKIYHLSQLASQDSGLKLENSEYTEIFENSDNYELLDMDFWQIEEANDHYLRAVITGNATMTENVETEDVTYFSGNNININYEIVFEKMGEKWTMTIQDITEVNY